MDEDCVFCQIVVGAAPAVIAREWPDAIAFRPLGPVTPGHMLVIPRQHVANAIEDPAVTASIMFRAAEFADGYGASNILTSTGRAATQSVFHLHIHVIPRAAGDQLMVPWGTTGDPQAPHQCKRASAAEAALAEVKRLCELTIDVSCRSDAIAQAEDTLAAIDRVEAGHG